ncbi:hypothetical protein AVEN_231934-1, partial [Araneus ventricosus]
MSFKTTLRQETILSSEIQFRTLVIATRARGGPRLGQLPAVPKREHRGGRNAEPRQTSQCCYYHGVARASVRRPFLLSLPGSDPGREGHQPLVHPTGPLRHNRLQLHPARPSRDTKRQPVRVRGQDPAVGQCGHLLRFHLALLATECTHHHLQGQRVPCPGIPLQSIWSTRARWKRSRNYERGPLCETRQWIPSEFPHLQKNRCQRRERTSSLHFHQ